MAYVCIPPWERWNESDEGETWSIKVVGDSYIGLSYYKFNGFINEAENCYELYYLNRSGDIVRFVMKL